MVFGGETNREKRYISPTVLDKNGKQIHTQESGSLEEGKGYSLDKVKAFFEAWKPKK